MSEEEFYANVIDLSDTNQVNESIIEMQEQQYKKLMKKYEKAVSDYEQEHYKVVKAIEYIKQQEIDIFSAVDGRKVLEILGDKENDNRNN